MRDPFVIEGVLFQVLKYALFYVMRLKRGSIVTTSRLVVAESDTLRKIKPLADDLYKGRPNTNIHDFVIAAYRHRLSLYTLTA